MKTFKILLGISFCITLIQNVSGQQSITKVAFIGNSITAGSGLSNPTLYAYPAQLGNMLTSDWQIGNFGVSGRTMLKKGDFPIWAEQKFADALKFNPNIVVIMLGTNDSKYYNWAYKADYYKDYVSMIDTFAHLASKPKIYICYPLKVFSKLYDINDVVIHDEIIPIIHQVSIDKNVKIIDCYTPTLDKSSLLSDGIHPNIAGAHFVAEIMYTALTGKTYTKVFDENILLRKKLKSISADNSINMYVNSAIDGDLYSSWTFKGFPSSLTIDIGSIQQTDQFELFFKDAKTKGIQYKIETSTDSSFWTMVVDKTLRTDIISNYDSNIIPSTEMRFVRLTITGISNSTDDLIRINEFKALKYHGYFHAPIISAGITKTTTTALNIIPPANMLNMSLLRFNKTTKAFDAASFVKDFSVPYIFNFIGTMGAQYIFMSNSYSNGTDVYSDTTSFTFKIPTENIYLKQVDNTYFQAFPVPSSGQIKIIANREINESVRINVMGMKGELIENIHPQGPINKNEVIVWKGSGSLGKKPSPGIYFIQIEGKTIHENLKVVLN